MEVVVGSFGLADQLAVDLAESGQAAGQAALEEILEHPAAAVHNPCPYRHILEAGRSPCRSQVLLRVDLESHERRQGPEIAVAVEIDSVVGQGIQIVAVGDMAAEDHGTGFAVEEAADAVRGRRKTRAIWSAPDACLQLE